MTAPALPAVKLRVSTPALVAFTVEEVPEKTMSAPAALPPPFVVSKATLVPKTEGPFKVIAPPAVVRLDPLRAIGATEV